MYPQGYRGFESLSLRHDMKKIRVKVSAGAKTEKVVEVEPDFFRIRVNEPPEKGKANARVIELLAEYYGIPESLITLVLGAATRDKIFHIGI